jgi:uncharacterized repeat protein (TIGR01451 family)
VVATALTQASPVALAAPPVDLPGPPSADGVVPVIRDTQSSSDECGELGFDHGVSITGNGSVSSGDRTMTVSGSDSPTGFVDWSSNLPIHGVYVKGGPSGGNLFAYPGGDTGDQDLHTPRKLGGGFYAVSHVAFCWNDATLEPDVTVAKSNEPAGTVGAGDPITYSLIVANVGDADATAVVVTDVLPAGVTFVTATPGCDEAAGTVTCALGDVGPGASLDVDITVNVDAETCGPISNVASVAAGNEPDAATGNNGSNEVSNSVGCTEPTPPDVAVTKTSSAGGVLDEGDAFTYTITVTNLGDVDANGVRFVDTLPSDDPLSIDLSSFPTFGGRPCTIASSESPGGIRQTTLHCGPISLAAGGSATVELDVEVNGSRCGPLLNVVDVEASNEPAENVGPDNHAQTSDEITCPPRIRIVKDGPDVAHEGDTIAYSFAVSNPGGTDLTDVQVTDPACDGTIELIDAGDGDAILATGEGWIYRCERTITAADGDPVPNTATASGSADGGTVTDSDGHEVDVLHPAIAIDKTASPTSGTPGTAVVYRYVVTNVGDTTLFDISVDDDLLGHVGDVASLTAGASTSLTLDFTLGSAPVTNIATVSGADLLGRVVTADDTASVTVVAAGGGDDDGGTGGTPFTGVDPGSWILAAATALALGASAVAGTRRRARRSV